MVRVRSEGLMKVPPLYHPDSNSLTLAIYYGGKAVLGEYEGGKVRKIDYVDRDKLKFEQLKEYVQDLFVEGSVIRWYVPVQGGYKLLLSNLELRRYAKKYMGKVREYPLVFDTVIPEDTHDAGGGSGNEDRCNEGNDGVNEQNVGVNEENDGETKENDGETKENDGVNEENNDVNEYNNGLNETKDTDSKHNVIDENVEDNETEDKEIEVEVRDELGGDARMRRESSVEFLSRAEATKEWIDEYNRRYPGVPRQSVEADVIDDVHGDVPDYDSDESDQEFCVSNESVGPDDDLEFDDVVDNGIEPDFNVKSDPLRDDVVFMDFDVVYDSAEDSDFVPKEVQDSSIDDSDFEDYVSASAELKNGDDESNSESSDSSFSMDDVVGNGAEDFDMGRVSADEAEPVHFPAFNMDNIFDPTFYLGQTFLDKDTFKLAVNSYAIKTRRSLGFTKSCAQRCYVKCDNNRKCPFKLNAMIYPGEKETYVLREINLEHVCAESYNVKNLKTPWLVARYVALFKSDPKRNVMGWRADVQEQLDVDVSVSQAYRAKRKAVEKLEGDPDFQYTKLWDYASELRKTNPDSTVILGTDDSEGDLRFSKFYVCFKAMKTGFKNCRPIIGVDGCFLKGPHGGVLLTAVGVDPNNSIFPIAYAVVSTENKENWDWFFNVLKTDLQLGTGQGFTFISDKQKGLINALPEVFPAAEIRFCVRHLIVNLNSAGHKGLDLKNVVYKAANATTMGTFRAAMKQMRLKHPGAYEWFMDKHPSQWSKSHFMEICKCDQLLNNSCESFNSSILLAREKPILTMLEWIREYLMKLLQKAREEAGKWEELLCPRIADILVHNGKGVGGCRPIKVSRCDFQIQTIDGSQYAVNLDDRVCSCRGWQLSGIPCTHALSAINHEKMDAVDFVDACYTVTTYNQVYSGIIYPISGHDVWGPTMCIPPLPPNFGRKPGRPKKLRRRGKDEDEGNSKKKHKKGSRTQKLRRFQTTIHCQHCRRSGHNTLSCPDLPQSTVRIMDRLFDKARKCFEAEAGPSLVDEINESIEVDRNEDKAEEPPVILPPIQVTQTQSEVIEETQVVDGTPYAYNDEPTNAGPSMFEQLQLGNKDQVIERNRPVTTVREIRDSLLRKNAKRKGKAKNIQQGIRMRVLPTMLNSTIVMSQSSVCGPMTAKNIIVEGGKKFLSLSSPSKEDNTL